MTDRLKALADRITSMEDEELVALLENRSAYTPEALHLAEREADRRGGLAQLREKLAARRSDTSPDILRQTGMSTPFGRLWLWLVASYDRIAGDSVHDLIAGTFVVPHTVAEPTAVSTRMGRRHWLGLVIVVALPIAFIIEHRVTNVETYEEILTLQEELSNLDGFEEISYAWVTPELWALEVDWEHRLDSYDKAIDQVACIVLQEHPKIRLYDELSVGVFWGYDSWVGGRFTGSVRIDSPEIWQQRLQCE